MKVSIVDAMFIVQVHENEEFEQYEKPIHEFMNKYCPESTKVLKDMKNSKGRSYRW